MRPAGALYVPESFRVVHHFPNSRDSGDLEAATRTITAVAEAAGVGSADYSSLVTALKSAATYNGDISLLTILRFVARLQATIDSMTAGTLYCRVYLDAQDANHRLFDLSWATTGAKLAAVDIHAGALPSVLAKLNDGTNYTLYYFFWVDAGNAVISEVRSLVGVGTCSTTYDGESVYQLNCTGIASVTCHTDRVGSGSGTYNLYPNPGAVTFYNAVKSGGDGLWNIESTLITAGGLLAAKGTVATDSNLFNRTVIVLRKEQ